MPLLPTKFKFVKAGIQSDDPTQKPKSARYKYNASKRANQQRFDLDLTTVYLNFEQAAELHAFMMSLGGKYGVFTVKNPFNNLLPPNEINTIKLRQAISAGSTAAPCFGLTPNLTRCLKPGSYFKFANHAKVYMITNTVNANSLGQSTINFYPPLFAAVPSNTVVEYGSNVVFQVALNSDTSDLMADVKKNKLSQITIDCSEVG